MTPSAHDEVMKVEISELKAKLSVYIDAVKRGETVIVLGGNTPVAQLAPPPRCRRRLPGRPSVSIAAGDPQGEGRATEAE